MPDEIVRAAMLLRANTLAKGTSGARVETVELLLACLEPRRAARRSGARLGRRVRRPRAARASRAAARRRGRGVRRRRAAARAGGAHARRSRADRARGEGGPVADQRHAVHGGGARARPRARAPAVAQSADLACAMSIEALQGSRTSFMPQIHALRPLRGPGRLGGEHAAAARRLGDHRVASLVRQGAGRVLAALRAAGARRVARPARLLPTTRCRSSSTRRPTIRSCSSSDDALVSNGNFHGQPLAFALDALAMARCRAREHLRAARRASRQPEPLRRAARLPHDATAG